MDKEVRIDIDESLPDIETSPLLNRLLQLDREAGRTVESLPENVQADLSRYYNYILISSRAVVSNVHTEIWKSDLRNSLASVIFAREQISSVVYSQEELSKAFVDLASSLAEDAQSKWFQYALMNARRPNMIAMPSLPAINLGERGERFYVQAVSDSWPEKHVSKVVDGVLQINAQSSRRFVDGLVAGDLGGVSLPLAEHELSFIAHYSVGWITRYESQLRTVDIIEIDPYASHYTTVNLSTLQHAYQLVRVEEQRLNMFSIDMKLHSKPHFGDNLALSRLLAIDIDRIHLHMIAHPLIITKYVHTQEAENTGLGPVDEEVLLKSLGSFTAKNKARSAFGLAAKARLHSLNQHGSTIRNVFYSPVPNVSSKLVRCGIDGIYVRTKIPFDSLLIIVGAVVLSVVGCRALIAAEGNSGIAESTSLSSALTLGVGLTFHNLRFKSWPIGETVRLRRMCSSDEEMSHCMSHHELISTIAEAGAKGAGMDGILTPPFSNSRHGKFSVTTPIDICTAARVGLVLRIAPDLTPLWIDLKGVRAAEQTEQCWRARRS